MIQQSAESLSGSKPVNQDSHKDFSEAASRQMAIHVLKELAELHKAGVLTDEEFNAKKQELLARI